MIIIIYKLNKNTLFIHKEKDEPSISYLYYELHFRLSLEQINAQMNYFAQPFFVVLLLVCCLPACSPKELPSVFLAEKDHVVMKVSHQTTKPEMEKFSVDLQKMGVVLDYSSSVFYENGRLQALAFVVVFPDGTGGRAGADQVGLQYRYYGFEFKPGGSPPFRTGSFDQ
ncbi:MAG: hypothetical protein IPN29_05390 [Saprospiraceae bacterium]|nr:hypothetical protein [Saprospiraceae bacterium]